jgi:hypothetical protein
MKVACLTCGYDLHKSKRATGECPECGTPFDRSAIVSRQVMLGGWALTMLGYGALGIVLAAAIGVLVSLIPKAPDMSGGWGEEAARWLRLVPVTVVAGGLVVLGRLVARGERERFTFFWIGVVLWLLMLNDAVSRSATNVFPSARTWRHPEAWTFWSVWCAPFAMWAAWIAATVVIGRAARQVQMPGLVRLNAWAMRLAIAAVVPIVLLMAVREYAASRQQGAPSPFAPIGVAAPANYWSSPAPQATLAYFVGLIWTGLWLCIGLAGVFVGAVWNRERDHLVNAHIEALRVDD